MSEGPVPADPRAAMSEDDEIVEAFLEESRENLDQLDRDLVDLETRPSDPALMARWGGEEFLALVPGRPGASLAALGEHLRASVGNTPLAADVALYEAKRAGRNRVAVGAGS